MSANAHICSCTIIWLTQTGREEEDVQVGDILLYFRRKQSSPCGYVAETTNADYFEDCLADETNEMPELWLVRVLLDVEERCLSLVKEKVGCTEEGGGTGRAERIRHHGQRHGVVTM